MAKKKPKLLATHEIMHRALVLPPRNCGLILSVFLISLLVSSTIFLGYYSFIYPIIRDLADKAALLAKTDPFNPMFTVYLAAILRDTDELVLSEVVFFLSLFVFTTITRPFIIYAFAVTHAGHPVTLLSELLWQLIKVIRGAFITQVYVGVMSLIYVALWGISIFLLLFFFKGQPWTMPVIYFAAALAVVFFVYLLTLWSLSVAISVVEEKHFGFKAVMRAIELYQGNKLRGFPIIFIAAALLIGAGWVYNVYYDSSRPLQVILAMVFARSFVFEVVNLFILASITVYYYECRRGREEEVVEVIEDFAYTRLPGGEADVVVEEITYTRLPGSEAHVAREIVAEEVAAAGNVAGEIHEEEEEEVRIKVIEDFAYTRFPGGEDDAVVKEIVYTMSPGSEAHVAGEIMAEEVTAAGNVAGEIHEEEEVRIKVIESKKPLLPKVK